MVCGGMEEGRPRAAGGLQREGCALGRGLEVLPALKRARCEVRTGGLWLGGEDGGGLGRGVGGERLPTSCRRRSMKAKNVAGDETGE